MNMMLMSFLLLFKLLCLSWLLSVLDLAQLVSLGAVSVHLVAGCSPFLQVLQMWRNLQVEPKLQSPSYLLYFLHIILLRLLGWAITGDGAARFLGRVEAAGWEGQLAEVWSTEWQCLHHPSALMAMLAVNVCA